MRAATSVTTSAMPSGSMPPFVSHSTAMSAPAVDAPRSSTRSAVSGSNR